MDNVSKAIVMAGSVLMFILGVSSGIFLYTTLMEANDSILTSSERFSNSAEYFVEGSESTTREISAAEVAGNIISLENSNGFLYEKIMIDGVEKKKDKVKEILNSGDTYRISSIDLENLTINYKKN